MKLSNLSYALAAVLTLFASPQAFASCTGQFPANTTCVNSGGSTGTPSPAKLPLPIIAPIGGGTLIGNPTGSTATPTATNAPVLGVPGAVAGQLGFAGSGGGTAIIQAQPTAGSPTILLPNSSGTLPSAATSPLTLDPATGVLGCSTCVTSGSTLANPTALVGPVAINGTANSGIRSDGAPALNQAADYTLSGNWTFSLPLVLQADAAPSSPASGFGVIYLDSTSGVFSFKSSAGTVSTTVVPDTGASNDFLTAVSASGVISKARPACANLSDSSVFCSGTNASGLTGTVNTARLPSPFTSGTITGNTSAFTTYSGSAPVNGNCPQFDGSGNLVDSGSPCGGGGGSGTVTSALANQLAYYASSGTTVAGLATANNAVLGTNGSGVPSVSTTLPSGLTIPSPALSGTVTGAHTIPLGILAQSGANTMLGNWTSGTANVAANSMPSCPDSGTNHLNYVAGTGITCGTTSSGVPGGASTNVQFNNSGAFGGSGNFLWDGVGITIGASGTLGYLQLGNATTGLIKLQPVAGTLGTPTVSLPAATDTLVGKATTDVLTNKTYDTAGTGNVFKINGTGVSAVTGTGAAVLATSPSLTTPSLGVATASTINKVALTAPASGSTLTIADGKTLTATNSITLAGTDSTTMTFPGTSTTLGGLGVANVWTNSNSFSGVTTFSGSLKVAFRTVTAAGSVTVSATTDYFICINKTVGGATVVNLPAVAAGLTYLVKDCKGDANTNNITITPASGTVDGASTYVMNTNFQSTAVTSDGTNWFIN